MTREEKREHANEVIKSLFEAWTVERMTEQEKQRLKSVLEWARDCGTVDKMKDKESINYLLVAVFEGYLWGLGYSGANWREQGKE